MPPTPPIPQLSPSELKRRLDAGEPLAVLDVREVREHDWCALRLPPSAADLHVPMRQVPARMEEIQAAASGTLVVYCHHGVRSLAVAHWLADRGIAGVVNLDGGIDAWSAQVDPTVPRY